VSPGTTESVKPPSLKTERDPAAPLGRPMISLRLGDGDISPADISLRQLSEVLAAAAASLEGAAKESGNREPQLALTAIKHGSAKYEITARYESADEAFRAVASELQRSLETEPDDLPSALRKPFLRLAAAAGDYPLQITFYDPSRSQRAKTLPIPPPSFYLRSYVEGTTVLYGRVYGVERLKSRYSVLFKVDEGLKLEMDSDEATASKSAALFNKPAEARAVFISSAGAEPPTWQLEDILEWRPAEALDVFAEIGESLAESGGIDAEALIRRIRGT
jgi:hypothetical protein